ncbi:MAG: iron donor protein CyaY [Oxalobacter sp.]|nr:MAG: iron donor protein CyaY [Oxalobacter sp.]
MTESEFLLLAEAALREIESAVENVAHVTDIDIECARHGNVLDIEFFESGAKIIINIQTPMRELWLAAKTGGFHFKHDGHQWVDTRGGGELYTVLSRAASAATGQAIRIARA